MLSTGQLCYKNTPKLKERGGIPHRVRYHANPIYMLSLRIILFSNNLQVKRLHSSYTTSRPFLLSARSTTNSTVNRSCLACHSKSSSGKRPRVTRRSTWPSLIYAATKVGPMGPPLTPTSEYAAICANLPPVKASLAQCSIWSVFMYATFPKLPWESVAPMILRLRRRIFLSQRL